MVPLANTVKTTNIIHVSPDDTLAGALSKLSTSHDAAFVFENQSFKGVVNPYYCIIQNSYPRNAKVENCIYHPPKVYLDYPLEKVISLMISSKVHYLPTFSENNNFMGIISARHLLSILKNSPQFKQTIFTLLQKKHRSLITLYEEDSVSHALQLFKQHKVSKLVVINHDLKLKGILSYYDLIHFLVSPKEHMNRGEREGDKRSFYSESIKKFMRHQVLTLTPDDKLEKAVTMVLDKKIGSIVIIDAQRHPLGIITTSDFFHAILDTEGKIPLELFAKNLSYQKRKLVHRFVERFNNMAAKSFPVSKAKLSIKQSDKEKRFSVFFSILSKRGDQQVYKKEGRNLVELFNTILMNLKEKRVH